MVQLEQELFKYIKRIQIQYPEAVGSSGKLRLERIIACINLSYRQVDSTTLYHASTSLYLILLNSSMALLGSTLPYYTLPRLYLTLLDSTTLYFSSN